MSWSGTTRLVVVTAVSAVAALSLAAVRSTDALWTDSASTDSATVITGQLKLVAGSGSGSIYQFAGLNGAGILPGDQRQAPLAITNGGSTPLRYRLNAAGPQVSTPGSGVTLSLSGTVMAVGSTCGTGTLPGAAAFTTFTTSASGTAASSPWRSLAEGATETWCMRSTLQSVTGTGSATYTVLFAFGSEQRRT
ncbi:hypothetical protein BH683_022045 [Williamsia sp. 1138]|uniref:hypothetical protein n=1 Tax=Williamsia sp. 1138 TaxID=1903117 RepID=UPI000A11EE2B|nr:hypothetical protein [Williamsia sp. 1138]OZG27104.1 hypothetical protein BH683_022045 [Williamsia sp. 1138]